MKEVKAVSVIDECADIFYSKYKEMSERFRKRVSIEDLREIFNTMVIPCIDEARRLDREN